LGEHGQDYGIIYLKRWIRKSEKKKYIYIYMINKKILIY